METERPTLSPLAALGVAAVLLLATHAVSSVFYSLGLGGMTVDDPVEFVGRLFGQFAPSIVRAAVIVGGIFAALTLGRLRWTLLVVTPVAFACFLGLSLFGLVTFFGNGALALALSTALGDTGLLVALALVAGGIRDEAAVGGEVDSTPAD